jgi:DNA mismatch endonuclease Vsr
VAGIRGLNLLSGRSRIASVCATASTSEAFQARPILSFLKVVFVHGCFWHLHRCKLGKVTPRTNRGFWAAKRTRNRARDRHDRAALRRDGWAVLVLWECRCRNPEWLARRLLRFLG